MNIPQKIFFLKNSRTDRSSRLTVRPLSSTSAFFPEKKLAASLLISSTFHRG